MTFTIHDIRKAMTVIYDLYHREKLSVNQISRFIGSQDDYVYRLLKGNKNVPDRTIENVLEYEKKTKHPSQFYTIANFR